MYSIVVVTGQHDHKKDDDTVLQTLKIIQDQHRPLETSFSLFSDLCRNPKRRPNLIKISRESNLSKTDDRPRSRHRHNKESTREPTSALMHQTFIHFSTFHLKQSCNNQKAEELVLITVVFKMYLSRFHCRWVQSIMDANESFKCLKKYMWAWDAYPIGWGERGWFGQQQQQQPWTKSLSVYEH